MLSTLLRLSNLLPLTPCPNLAGQELGNLGQLRYRADTPGGEEGLRLFAAHLLGLVLHYFILQGVVQCRVVLRQYKVFGLVLFHQFQYHLARGPVAAALPEAPWLESTALEAVARREDEPAGYVMALVLDTLLGPGRMMDPAAQLILLLMQHQPPAGATLATEQPGFWGQEWHTLTVPGDYAATAACRAREAVEAEAAVNPTFRRFTDRLHRTLCRCLEAKTMSAD